MVDSLKSSAFKTLLATGLAIDFNKFFQGGKSVEFKIARASTTCLIQNILDRWNAPVSQLGSSRVISRMAAGASRVNP